MDHAEQSPRVPSRGSFDTASLLAPSTTIFNTQTTTSVRSPLPHLTHSPSAFCVLGRNAVLVPPPLPPSSNSDVSSSNSGGKMCPPIIHQSASDALSSLASSSSSGACGWWPSSTSVMTTADFTGCGVTAIGDPFSRTSLCGRSLVSSPHLSLPQPRRIVEEVLGHLYAKPPSAECKAETQTSGINDSQQVVCKSTSLPASDLQSPQVLNSVSVISSEKEVIQEKNSESSVVNNIPLSLPTVLSVPVISSCSVKSKKLDVNKNSTSAVPAVPQKSNRRKRLPKDPNAVDGIKNGKKVKSSNSKHKPQTSKKRKEKSAKNLSSDSESHGESTSSSSGGAESSSGAATASSGSSDSTDEEEREKQQQELARLKKQQKELRRKVQELKQASHESNQQKVDAQIKKGPVTPKPSPRTVNHVKKPVPSPAHSSSTMAISPKSFPQKPKHNLCTDDDANMSVPLDLCVKKQEPMFEVTSSSILSPPYVTMASMAKKQLQAMTFNQPAGGKLQSPGPKRRGRKPKALSHSNILPPDVAHQLKQNIVKDFNSMGLPQKLWLPPTNNAKNVDANSQKKSINSVNPSKAALCLPGELPNSISSPRKTFTLDSLLGESNGTFDFCSSPNNIDIPGLTLGSRNSKTKDRMRYSNRIKKGEEKGKEFDLSTKHESSSATDSEPDNEHSDSEESTLENNSNSAGHKRSFDEDGEDFSSKRRRVIPDEREIRIPLEHGWRRETKIRCFSRSGVRGEITYYTPCGKKLRSYPEVIRYLVKNGITDISRDNFTFSTKVIVGEFLECTSSGNNEGYIHLNEHEVVARINEIQSRKSRTSSISNKKSQQPKSSDQEEQQRLWEQKQIQHQLEQQAEEARRQKEQQRILKQQERFERMEQLRIEREIRAQQLLEEQEMKRQQAAYLREQEMQKRREMLLMVDLERERRRQHMMLVRALETRKKQEERERKREEMLYEKRINKEKKLEQRRIELDYLRELKKPVEDMMLKDNVPLPTLNRIPGLKLAGKAFADVLMVFEFLQNFGETLGFDSESLPTLNTLQMALLNMDEKLEEELLSVIHHLLVCAIEDPGVPHSSESATVLGQNLKDADVTNNNVSEVLRLYFIAQDKRNIMCQWLHAKPFLALNAAQKAEILAHICNDLLGSRVLMRKVDSNIENVNVLRKDKWLIEGDLRRLKTVQQRRLLKARQLTYEESKLGVGGTNTIPTDTSSVCSSNNASKDDQNISDAGLKNAVQCDKDKLDDLDNDNESGNDSDDTQAHGIVSDADDEDLQLSNEELTKKVDKLSKQLTSYSNKLTKALHTIRGCTFGQDRYHRRYWVLPKAGGIFVESLESSELPEYQELILAEQDTEESSDKNGANDDAVEIKKEIDSSIEGRDRDVDDVEMKDLSNLETKDLNKLETTDLSNLEIKDLDSLETKDSSSLGTKSLNDLEENGSDNPETNSLGNMEMNGLSKLEIETFNILEKEDLSNQGMKSLNNKQINVVHNHEPKGLSDKETKGLGNQESNCLDNQEAKCLNNQEANYLCNQETKNLDDQEIKQLHNDETKRLSKQETETFNSQETKNLTDQKINCLSNQEIGNLNHQGIKNLSNQEIQDWSNNETKDLSKLEINICQAKEIPESENLLKENMENPDELIDKTFIKKEMKNIEAVEKKNKSTENKTCKIELEIKKELIVKESDLNIAKDDIENSVIINNHVKEETVMKVLTSDTEIDEKMNMELEKTSERKKLKDRHNKNSEKSFLNEALDKKPDVNIFMPKFCDNLGLEACPSLNHTIHNSSERKLPSNPSIPANQNWILHSPFFASLLAGNMLFNGPQLPGRESNGTYFNLPKSDSNNPFGPFLGIGQSGLLSPEQVFKSLSDKSGNQKPWFSILPRMPCDEDSLPKSHCAKNPFSSSLLYTPPSLLASGNSNASKSPSQTTQSIQVTSSSSQGQLSNLQMEILNGMPQGFFLHPFLPHQFGPTYQSGLPVNNTSPTPFSASLSHSGTVTDFNLNLGHPPASSTPSSIPTPSATPGPNSQGCGTPTYRDSPSPSFAKKFMMEKLTQEYDKPKPIPFELQKGWWRITDPSQLKDIVNALHHRGIREKMLQKQLQKHFNYGSTSCSQGTDKDTDLEITDMDRKISELPGGVPLANNVDEWSRDVALRVDLSILEQIENLEEKIDGASMQIKGWKPPPKLSTEPVSKFIPACELYLQVKCDITDSPRERNPKKSSKKSARKKKAEARKRALEAEAAAEKAEEISAEVKLDEAETDNKQDIVMSDSIKENLNERGKTDNEDIGKTGNEDIGKTDDIPVLPPGKINPVEEAKNRLLMVEAAIERRYLKPPLGFSSNDLNRSVSGGTREIYDNGEDEPIPVGLHKWRNSVNLCRSSSQLAMCLNYLENYTAWDKSIMRASCQFCHSGENEEMLLLCDGCDKGYHTYCFKPKMEKIPDGDWYCYECLNKATGDNVCVICGKKGKLIECASCPKCFHISCLEPPLGKIPKGKWFCSGCNHTKPKKSSKKSSASKDREKDKEKEKEQKESSGNKKADSEPTSKPKTSDRKEKKEKNRSPPNEDLASCIAVVEEMEKHDDSWPFLTPVNTKQFPTYRKVIKKPMDLTTVRSKLDSNQYKSREDFAADVRLIFDNCETFNEDDSPVGQAGHTMRAFFDTRWAELCST